MALAVTVTGDTATVAPIDEERMPDPRPPPETVKIPEAGTWAIGTEMPMAQVPASISAPTAALQVAWG